MTRGGRRAGAGRKPKDKSAASKQIQVRVTGQQKETIRKGAQQLGVGMSDYIRHAALTMTRSISDSQAAITNYRKRIDKIKKPASRKNAYRSLLNQIKEMNQMKVQNPKLTDYFTGREAGIQYTLDMLLGQGVEDLAE